MTQTTVSRTIDAPLDLVFNTVAHIDNFSKAIPHIVEVEFLSDRRSGVGTRFRETRLMKGKRATTELEVVVYVENDRIRIVADTHGTVWDSVFVVRENNGRTDLTLTMEAKPYKLLSKLMTLLITPMLKKALEQDLDAVKRYCERPTEPR